METVENYIRREYVDNGKSISNIAKSLKSTSTYIKKHLENLGIPLNTYKYQPATLSNEEAIKRFKIVHGDKYTYDFTKYTSRRRKVIITCPKHGNFNQLVDNHRRGYGCPKCGANSSKGEEKIEKYLMGRNIKYQREYKTAGCKYKNTLGFDFSIWINGQQRLIEYNGIQHYKPVSKFGGQESLDWHITTDKIKFNYCAQNNIPLLVIPYWEDIESNLDMFCKTPT